MMMGPAYDSTPESELHSKMRLWDEKHKCGSVTSPQRESMTFMRQAIPMLFKYVFNVKEDATQKKVRGMWTTKPTNYKANVPFVDPNNRHGVTGKPKKDLILPMFKYLVDLYYKQIVPSSPTIIIKQKSKEQTVGTSIWDLQTTSFLEDRWDRILHLFEDIKDKPPTVDMDLLQKVKDCLQKIQNFLHTGTQQNADLLKLLLERTSSFECSLEVVLAFKYLPDDHRNSWLSFIDDYPIIVCKIQGEDETFMTTEEIMMNVAGESMSVNVAYHEEVETSTSDATLFKQELTMTPLVPTTVETVGHLAGDGCYTLLRPGGNTIVMNMTNITFNHSDDTHLGIVPRMASPTPVDDVSDGKSTNESHGKRVRQVIFHDGDSEKSIDVPIEFVEISPKEECVIEGTGADDVCADRKPEHVIDIDVAEPVDCSQDKVIVQTNVGGWAQNTDYGLRADWNWLHSTADDGNNVIGTISEPQTNGPGDVPIPSTVDGQDGMEVTLYDNLHESTMDMSML